MNNIFAAEKKIVHKFSMFVFSIFGILLAYLPFFYFYDRTPNNDWSYFNSLALVIKSSILQYKQIPIHDPWVCGGIDLWANPQNWIFSPSVILTILFSPYISNVLSLIVFSLIGFWGCYKFFRYYDIDKYISFGSALLFINNNWFGLHFIAGHIIYRSLLLMPYILYLFFNFKTKKTFVFVCFF